jgi:hypothetical protein
VHEEGAVEPEKHEVRLSYLTSFHQFTINAGKAQSHVSTNLTTATSASASSNHTHFTKQTDHCEAVKNTFN